MRTVDYAFYTAIYHGRMSEEEFQRMSVRAGAYLDALTAGRAGEPLPDTLSIKVKLALCAVADAMLYIESGGDIASESNDGISVTYASKTTKTDAQRLREAAELHLAWTGLIYRGC